MMKVSLSSMRQAQRNARVCTVPNDQAYPQCLAKVEVSPHVFHNLNVLPLCRNILWYVPPLLPLYVSTLGLNLPSLVIPSYAPLSIILSILVLFSPLLMYFLLLLCSPSSFLFFFLLLFCFLSFSLRLISFNFSLISSLSSSRLFFILSLVLYPLACSLSSINHGINSQPISFFSVIFYNL